MDVVTNVHNTASTFKPYDPGQAIGNTQPTLPDPPPPPSKGGGCGGFLIQIIAIVVVVVVTVYTAGTMTAPAGASFGTIMSAGATALGGGMGMAGMGAAAVGGAVGAAAGQGVLIAGGQQSGFNWTGVALGAVAAGASAGVGSAASAMGAAGSAGSTSFGSAMAQGAARSVVTQGIGVATGLQDRFDWKGVAASAIASGVGAKVGSMTTSAGASLGWSEGATKFGSSLSAGMAAGTASTLARGGSLGRNVGAIAADSFASTVGNMVITQVQASSIGKTDYTKQAIENMNAQVLPGGWGGVNSGFVPPPETPYSGASLLYGLGMGAQAAPTPLAGKPFQAQFDPPQPGVLVADRSGSFLPTGGARARTVEDELTGANSSSGGWWTQSPAALMAQGIANGLSGISWGGGMPPPATPGLALVGSTAMGLAKAVTGLMPSNAIFNSGNEDRPSSVSSSTKAEFKEFNQAQKAAMEWLGARGFKAEQPTLAKFGDNAGKPIGMKSSDGRVEFRVEYDERSGAHINVFAGKEKGPHFTFEGNQSTVDQIVRQYGK
ncbi:hypothetical protein FAZ69_10945 [Trinickia terrae]|uniref:Uncharacterized protein n=1 Tax=Trinickia terrae TaxID=2571161 RepID=A0A4U1I7P9_9BURK|nr:hypothetical protein [Trinickia terrae]TKC89446.1 hypothetical protein FAZ69_10945 [Trinickia terrae]